MDRDTCPPGKPRYQKIAEELGKRVGCTAWTTDRKELENYIHPDIIKGSCPGYSGVGTEFEDVPMLLPKPSTRPVVVLKPGRISFLILRS
jgi:hypothetical protein